MEPRGLKVTYDGVEYSVGLSEAPLTIGRAPTNGLSLTDHSVSWHHASVWIADGEVHIRDLNSTNGVTLNGARLRGEAVFPAGAEALIGHHVRLSLVQLAARPEAQLVLEDLLRGRRFSLSPGENTLVDLGVLPEGALRWDAGGALTLVLPSGARPLALRQPVELPGARFQVVEAERADTVGQQDEPYPYRLTVRLEGPRGPEAELLHRVTKARLVITSENRVVLLYLLARKVVADLAAGKPSEERGWCDDEDLTVGIWGRGDRSLSALPVTVHRLRKELSAEGFDHHFLEKQRLVLRARLIDVVVE